jgi:hypothetical protein
VDTFPGARLEMNYAPVQRPEKQMIVGFSTNIDSSGQIPGGKTVDIQTQLFIDVSVAIAGVC